jgi:hypothetical protein
MPRQPARTSLRSFAQAGLGLAAAGLIGGSAPRAEACSTAGCPLVTQSQDGIRARGSFNLDLSFRYMNQDRYLRAEDARGELFAPYVDFEGRRILEGHHRDKGMRHQLLQVEGSYGVTDALTVFGSLPLLNEREHEQNELLLPGTTTLIGHDVHGPVPEGAVVSGFTTEHGAGGIGDVQLGAGYALLRGADQSLAARLTIELPTGEHERRDAAGRIERPDLQPGSGSTDLLLSLQHQRSLSLGGAAWFTAAAFRRNGGNSLDYRFGDEVSLSSGVTGAFTRSLRWSLQLAARRTARDSFLGVRVPATGATTLNLVPGLRFRAPGGVALYAYAKLPVHQSVNESQLAPRLDVITGLVKGF